MLALTAVPIPAAAVPKADLWAIWLPSEKTSTQTVDHSAWQRFLDSYVSPAATGVNLVNYSAVTSADREALNGYLASLAALDPRGLNKDEQLAYWINLYNALTVEVVLRNPKKGSILRMGAGFLSIGPWDDKLFEVAGEPLTLNDIEHRIIRPIWADHRIHYAVNCASIGCPNLSTTAYSGAAIDEQLAAAERDYINHERGVRFTDRGKLQLSSIFKWYREDFARTEAELIAYLTGLHDTLAGELESYQRGVDYKYDWNLNRPPP
ncbi:MAG: DUF547 domain-containing protein [Pseudomonadota bacterium]